MKKNSQFRQSAMTHIVFEEMHDINALYTAAREDHERIL